VQSTRQIRLNIVCVQYLFRVLAVDIDLVVFMTTQSFSLSVARGMSDNEFFTYCVSQISS